MKKLIGILLLLLLLVGGYFAWVSFGPSTGFREPFKYLYIPSDSASKAYILSRLEKDSMVENISAFSMAADRMDYWKNIKAGKYKIEKGSHVVGLVRKLKNGTQEPVNLVILKFRTKEALAGAMGKRLEPDSLSFISFFNNKDSMGKFGLDTNTVMTSIFPNTYTHFWNTSPKKVFDKFYEEYQRIWTTERKEKAAAHNLSPTQAHILASIIEEETNDKDDKPLMASVYINRLTKGMRLGADPTVKFAMRDFDLKRIYEKHTLYPSPYNTYLNTGLPPGPICTPTIETLDAVLNSPQTEYLFFVAKSDFSGKHLFTVSYQDHMKYAKEYQEALNKLIQERTQSDSAK